MLFCKVTKHVSIVNSTPPLILLIDDVWMYDDQPPQPHYKCVRPLLHGTIAIPKGSYWKCCET